MHVRTFTLRLDPTTGQFDDEALAAFCAEHHVRSIHQHMLMVEHDPCWAVLLTHTGPRHPRPAPEARPSGRSRSRPPAPAVPEADRALYDRLRTWRSERAKADGRPPFSVFRNATLLELSHRRPQTIAQLRQVHGIGEARARDYGAELIELCRSTPTEATTPPAPEGTEAPHG